MPRPTDEVIADAIEALASAAEGKAEEALDVIKDAVALPELVGSNAAAEILGTTAGNLKRWSTLPEPLYSPDHPDTRRRVAIGNLYDADAIRDLAQRRETTPAR